MVFLERELLLQKIFSRINASRPQSISITGDLKIGKTVLLEQILNEEIKRKYLDDSKKYCYFYKNLKQNKTGHIELIQDIILSFSPMDKPEKLSGDNVYNTLNEIISDRQNEISFIIVLDNFNVLTQDYSVPLEFFSFLRSLANSFPVAYIISSVCPLQEMCARKEVGESPFFNIFTNIELKSFSDEEGGNFLLINDCKLPLDKIKSLSGLHPFFLQQVIELTNYDSNPKNFENVKKALIEVNRPFVRNLLKCFPDQYPQLLISLALGIKPSEKEHYIVNKLIQKGYVNQDFRISSEILQSVLVSINRENRKDEFYKKIKRIFSFRS